MWSPPICFAIDPRSPVEATTLSFACAIDTANAIANSESRIFFIAFFLLGLTCESRLKACARRDRNCIAGGCSKIHPGKMSAPATKTIVVSGVVGNHCLFPDCCNF
jgi:hypothetical protein